MDGRIEDGLLVLGSRQQKQVFFERDGGFLYRSPRSEIKYFVCADEGIEVQFRVRGSKIGARYPDDGELFETGTVKKGCITDLGACNQYVIASESATRMVMNPRFAMDKFAQNYCEKGKPSAFRKGVNARLYRRFVEALQTGAECPVDVARDVLSCTYARSMAEHAYNCGENVFRVSKRRAKHWYALGCWLDANMDVFALTTLAQLRAVDNYQSTMEWLEDTAYAAEDERRATLLHKLSALARSRRENDRAVAYAREALAWGRRNQARINYIIDLERSY